MRLRVADLQNSRIPIALNVPGDDERFFAWLNEAEDLMLNQGRFWGSLAEAQFCTVGSCLVLPRQVATVEAINVNGAPIPLNGGTYGFTRFLAWNGGGVGGWPSSACRGGAGACDVGIQGAREKDGTVASFATTQSGEVIRTYPTLASDVGKKIIYQGSDANGIWVRTIIDGVMQDGEEVTLTLPFVDTITTWGTGAPVATIKAPTLQRVLVYGVLSGVERALAIYEPNETNPTYRQVWIPGLDRVPGCCVNSGTLKTLTCLVSLQHVPLSHANDWLVLQNLSAYKAAMMAVKAMDNGDMAAFNFWFYGTQAASRNARGVEKVVNRAGAIPLLQAELRKYTSDRTSAYIYTDETQKYVRTMAAFI